jgi:hypothetical protein
MQRRQSSPVRRDCRQRRGQLHRRQRRQQMRVAPRQRPVHQRAGQGGGPDIGRERDRRNHQTDRQQHAIATAGVRQPDRDRQIQRCQQHGECQQHAAGDDQITPLAAKPIAGPEQEGGGAEQTGEHHQGVDETTGIGNQKQRAGHETEAADEPTDVLRQKRRDQLRPTGQGAQRLLQRAGRGRSPIVVGSRRLARNNRLVRFL